MFHYYFSYILDPFVPENGKMQDNSANPIRQIQKRNDVCEKGIGLKLFWLGGSLVPKFVKK